MATRSKKANSEERDAGDDGTEDGEIKDAQVTIADLSTAVVAPSNIAT